MSIYAPPSPTPPSSDRCNGRIYIGLTLLAALLPAFLGLSYGLLIRPQIAYDPTIGLLTWFNYTNGGTWNTLLEVDFNDISQVVEKRITWWAPGQYLFLGLLHSAGLSLGAAALLLAFISSVSGSLGMAALTRVLGASKKALPWIAATSGLSLNALNSFRLFHGGEVLLIGLWPWVAVVMWILRNRSTLLIAIAPALLLLGSFIKHSFATYALSTITFIFLEKLREQRVWASRKGLSFLKGIAIQATPLIVVGALYVVGRHYLIDTNATPSAAIPGYYIYSIKDLLSFLPQAPVYALFGIRIQNTPLFYGLITSLFFILPITSIGLYTFLSISPNRLARFAGISALITITALFLLHLHQAAIELDFRFHQQAGSLLLALVVITLASSKKRRRLCTIALISLLSLMTARGIRTIQVYRQDSTAHHIETAEGIRHPIAAPVAKRLGEIISTAPTGAVLFSSPKSLPHMTEKRHHPIALLLNLLWSPQPGDTFKGRASQVIIALRSKDNLESVAERFVDYAEHEWTREEIEDWTFMYTGATKGKGYSQ